MNCADRFSHYFMGKKSIPTMLSSTLSPVVVVPLPALAVPATVDVSGATSPVSASLPVLARIPFPGARATSVSHLFPAKKKQGKCNQTVYESSLFGSSLTCDGSFCDSWVWKQTRRTPGSWSQTFSSSTSSSRSLGNGRRSPTATSAGVSRSFASRSSGGGRETCYGSVSFRCGSCRRRCAAEARDPGRVGPDFRPPQPHRPRARPYVRSGCWPQRCWAFQCRERGLRRSCRGPRAETPPSSSSGCPRPSPTRPD